MASIKAKGFLWSVLMWVLVLGLSFALWRASIAFEQGTGLGYLGLFLIAIISSATLLIPGPSLVAVLIAGTVYHPLAVGIIMGSGAGLGEITGYLAGAAGRGLGENSNVRRMIERWMRRWGFLTLFLLAAVPNFVLFDVAGIIAGATRYDFLRFALAAVLGKMVRFTIGAYAGLAGGEVFRAFVTA